MFFARENNNYLQLVIVIGCRTSAFVLLLDMAPLMPSAENVLHSRRLQQNDLFTTVTPKPDGKLPEGT